MIIRLGVLLAANDGGSKVRTTGAFQDVLWQLSVALVHFAGCISFGIVGGEVIACSAGVFVDLGQTKQSAQYGCAFIDPGFHIVTSDQANVLGQQDVPDNFVVVSQQVYGLETEGVGNVQREADRLDRKVLADADGRGEGGHGGY